MLKEKSTLNIQRGSQLLTFKTMQQSLEEILRAKMAVPVYAKDPKTGKQKVDNNGVPVQMLPMEAIAMAIMNNAMKGDLAAANFIRQLTGTSRD